MDIPFYLDNWTVPICGGANQVECNIIAKAVLE